MTEIETIKYIEVYKKKHNDKELDVFTEKNSKKLYLRAEANYDFKEPKMLNGFNLNPKHVLTDPLHGFAKLSEVQQNVLQCIPKLPFRQGFCFNAACGSGKTRATLKIIQHYKLKTLIISTRNAVNDQWKAEISTLYPNLKISKHIEPNIDIIVTTPHYIAKQMKVFDHDLFRQLQVDLIVYDEVHSLLSESFSNVFKLPFMMVDHKLWKYLPYFIGLTASLPEDLSLIKLIFGNPILSNDDIRLIPVNFLDYRDLIPNKGKFDVNYKCPDERNTYKFFIKYIDDHNIKPTKEFKMIVINGSINGSMYCGLQIANYFQTNILIIRSNNEKDLYIHYDKIPPPYVDEGDIPVEEMPTFDIKDILEDNNDYNFIERCNYQEKINQCSIIVGTYHRLKEGFNCENIVYGMCTQFPWSIEARIQILGRIRRKSNKEELNKHKRLFLVCSHVIPSNIKQPHRYGPVKLMYNLEREKALFEKENYIRMDK
jgi:hypothetical protein